MEARSVLDEAKAWIADDPDSTTRQELQALVDGNALDELAERFAARLEFGTAGIRGSLGAGPGRMNRALVRRVTAGFAAYLLDAYPDAREKGIVVGRDARHLSLEFARDTAAVLAGAGIPCHFFADPVPTPVCAYTVTALGVAGGVMVTASHNPAADNGYKVYWRNGAQIIPPHDAGISRAIDAVGAVRDLPFLEEAEARGAGLFHEVPPEVGEAYLKAVVALQRHPEVPRDLRIVYTPLHGVGGRWATEALSRAGFRQVHAVPEQMQPDPDFPTVRFPNPEEPGALDLARALARTEGADLVLANDPDADRLAVCVAGEDGEYRSLSGNEIGTLLADYLLSENPIPGEQAVMTTIVSTSLLGKMAAERGVHYAETLTGFKWIANRAIDMKAQGVHFVCGFEEALGYTVGELVRDKDGMGTAVVFADLAAFCRAGGRTVDDRLEAIYRKYGLHASRQKSLALPGSEGSERIAQLMEGLRQHPPATVSGSAVRRRWDLSTGKLVDVESGEESTVDLPGSNVLGFSLEDGSRILARPSGTEPKIKFYFEVVQPVPEGRKLDESRTRAEWKLDRLTESFLKLAGVEG